MLSVRSLAGGYGGSQVLFDVCLDVNEGEIVGLLGRNGMGKTTTIAMMFGLLEPKSGTIEFEGEELTGRRPFQVARRGLSLVPEGRQVFPLLTVEQNLQATVRSPAQAKAPAKSRAPAKANPPPKAKAPPKVSPPLTGSPPATSSLPATGSHHANGGRRWTVDAVYELFPQLASRKSNFGTQLSGGEQQMLAIGRALVMNPTLLVLDEATEGLAPTVRATIFSALKVLKEQGQSILIVDAHLKKLLTLTDRNVLVEKGRTVWEGTSQAIIDSPAITDRYLGVNV